LRGNDFPWWDATMHLPISEKEKAVSKEFFRVQLENPEKNVRRLFGKSGNGALAARIAKEDKAQYDSLRRDAVKLGLLEPTSKELGAAVRKIWDDAKNPELTAQQVEAITTFPKETFKQISGDTVNRWKRENSPKYGLYRLAGATHGFFNHELVGQLNIADSENDGTLYEVPTAIREKLNLEPSLRLTKAGLERAGAAYAQRCLEEERQKAAQEKQAA
jgi:hypothetical protein